MPSAYNTKTPVGSIIDCPVGITPAGYLLCDGSAVSRSTYASLFNSIGITNGQGDGSTTFNLPDRRGMFVRGFMPGIGATVGGTASATVTFTDAGDLVTLANHGLQSSSIVYFKTITSTTGISINTPYYVISPTTNTFQLSLTPGGPAIPLTTNGTGVFKDFLYFPAHGFNRTGMKVRLTSGTITGLSSGVDYFIIVIDVNNIAFATTLTNAVTNVRVVISGSAGSAVLSQAVDIDNASRERAAPGGNIGAAVGSIQEHMFNSHTHTAGYNLGHAGVGGTPDTPWNSSGPATTAASGGNETRPYNITTNYFIKY